MPARFESPAVPPTEFIVLEFFMRCRATILAMGVLLALGAANAADVPKSSIRRLTAAVVRENLDLYERWAAYLRPQGRPSGIMPCAASYIP